MGLCNEAMVKRYKSVDMATGFNKEALSVPLSALLANYKVALDIGGSLAKVAYVSKQKENLENENECRICLVTFDTENLDECLDFILSLVTSDGLTIPRLKATGVGCVKYKEKISSKLKCVLETDHDEMKHSSIGMNILWRYLSKDELLYEGSDLMGLQFNTPIANSGLGPCLLVNLGSAMTIVHMTNMVGGSTLGGLSFMGLGVLLTKAKSFQELVDLAEQGDHRNVDLLVKDTAGSAYHNAPSDGMVSSFGKAAKAASQGKEAEFGEEDLASSILYAITDNLAHHTYMAARVANVNRVCFCGSYLSGNKTIIQQIQTKLNKASTYLGFTVRPIFLRHEGYLGAIGTLFKQDCVPNNSSSTQDSTSSHPPSSEQSNGTSTTTTTTSTHL